MQQDKEIKKMIDDFYERAVTEPNRGQDGEAIITPKGTDVRFRVWPFQEKGGHRILRTRIEDATTGDVIEDGTADIDTGETIPTSYDYPPRRS